jgi:release factor glutamine methyltransferase
VHARSASLVATDLSPSALTVARGNADRLGVTPQIEFVLADCWSALEPHASIGRFDLIVSNPPYISEAELATLEPEVCNYEPRLALTPGSDPLSFYRRIAAGLTDHLASGGALIVELGYGQAHTVVEIFREVGRSTVTLIDDLAGVPRVLEAH